MSPSPVTPYLAGRRPFLSNIPPASLPSVNRTAAGPTVPAGGLYLTKLWYNEDVL